jgi:hypothetical protein
MVQLQWSARVEVAKAAVDLIAGVFTTAKPSIRFYRRLPHAVLTVLLLPLIACRQDLSPTANGKIHFGVSAQQP